MPRASAVLLLAVLAAPSGLAHGLADALPQAGTSAAAVDPSVGVPNVTGPVHQRLADAARDAGFDPANLLPRLPWETINQVRSEAGTPWVPLLIGGQPVPADGPVQGQITFRCPGVGGPPSVTDGTNTMTVHTVCPYRIIDDADLLGSPQVAVNQNDPNTVAFFSLHGAGTTQGPSPRSRDPSPEGTRTLTGQSHTTFTSPDEGRSWYDNPWGTDGFGEHVSGVMDHDGNLYIAALWSKRLGDGAFDYVIKTYKEQDGRFQIANYQPSKTFPNRAAGNVIGEANLLYVPGPAPLMPEDPENATGNGTGNSTGNVTGPSGQGDVGNYTNGESFGTNNTAADRVLLVWHETARDWRNATTGKSAWIDAAWTDTSPHDNWTRLDTAKTIGPCSDASNPVAFRGKAYVACVVDAGYDARRKARIGDIDVWSIDPATGDTELVDFTQVSDGHPRLVARDDGMMALTSTKLVTQDVIEVQLTFGWYGKHWEGDREVGYILHHLASNTAAESGGVPLPPASNAAVEARITAMALTHADALVLVYMERVDPAQAPPDDPTNPSSLAASPDQAIEYKKLVATFTKCDGPHSVYDLQVGAVRHPFAEAILGNSTGVFDDLQDGMQVYQDPATGEDRIVFAYGDHGVVQYGALLADANLAPPGCINPPPALQLPPPPIPASLSAVSPATTMVGSIVGVTALSMVGYLLTVKRKSVVALATKAKK